MKYLSLFLMFAFTVLCLEPARSAFAQASEAQVAQEVGQEEKPAEEKPEKEEEPKEPKTVKLKTKDLVVYKTVSGVVESTRVTEVETSFEQWTNLVIDSVRPQGTVSVGDELVVFETDKIDKALAEAEFSLAGAKLDAEDANLSMDEVNKTAELNKKIADTKWKQSQEDHAYYFETAKPERIKSIKFSDRSSSWSVENAQEELDQLKKMYNEDQLTEESEMIVLKRAERSLESTRFYSERGKTRRQHEKEFELPRDDIEKENALTLAKLEHEKFVITSQIKKSRKEIALKKSEFELSEKEKKHKELLGDRENMSIKATVGGLLYYGSCKRGKWSGAGGTKQRELKTGQKIPVNKVIMTIVDPASVVIRGDLDEELVGLVKTGMPGTVKMLATKETFAVTANVPMAIPLDNGKFDVKFQPAQGVSLLPGATCKVSLLVHEAKNQLVAPKASVFSDDEINHYVFLADGSKVMVTVGMESDGDLEILDGLSAGQEILEKKPE